MNASDEQDPEMDRLAKICEELGEHFDNIQIFVSRFDSTEGTTSINYGSGNWHARRGHIQTWLTKEDERNRKEVREE